MGQQKMSGKEAIQLLAQHLSVVFEQTNVTWAVPDTMTIPTALVDEFIAIANSNAETLVPRALAVYYLHVLLAFPKPRAGTDMAVRAGVDPDKLWGLIETALLAPISMGREADIAIAYALRLIVEVTPSRSALASAKIARTILNIFVSPPGRNSVQAAGLAARVFRADAVGWPDPDDKGRMLLNTGGALSDAAASLVHAWAGDDALSQVALRAAFSATAAAAAVRRDVNSPYIPPHGTWDAMFKIAIRTVQDKGSAPEHVRDAAAAALTTLVWHNERYRAAVAGKMGKLLGIPKGRKDKLAETIKVSSDRNHLAPAREPSQLGYFGDHPRDEHGLATMPGVPCNLSADERCDMVRHQSVHYDSAVRDHLYFMAKAWDNVRAVAIVHTFHGAAGAVVVFSGEIPGSVDGAATALHDPRFSGTPLRILFDNGAVVGGNIVDHAKALITSRGASWKLGLVGPDGVGVDVVFDSAGCGVDRSAESIVFHKILSEGGFTPRACDALGGLVALLQRAGFRAPRMSCLEQCALLSWNARVFQITDFTDDDDEPTLEFDECSQRHGALGHFDIFGGDRVGKAVQVAASIRASLQDPIARNKKGQIGDTCVLSAWVFVI
jgi:hypothetical protein